MYAFPEVFVDGIESDKYVLELDDDGYVVVRDKSTYRYKRFFGHILYEDIIEYIELEKPLITRGFIVIDKYTGGEMRGFLVEKSVEPCLVEVSGSQVYVLLREGERVREGDKLSYTITGKGEVRVTKSPCNGFIALIINITWEKPEKYIIVVVNEDELRRITVREAT